MAQSDSGTIPVVSENIKVFPNPATNVINVLGLQNSNKAFISISDIYGNTLLQHQWEIKNNALNIPIAPLERGIYLITIQTEAYSFQTKFYKQ
ncbi:T9SS type A sorting domain-containing protein [Maribacter aestuarii]|uniref:T9SS type A sorting domain-containing protein n=1 Tax=Maribacter aestuarii TaxID=1130723 RepID=UPI00248AC2D3|nr:T9SS type A sorting domain-containing protein [Maribacter aestuarii]